MNHGGRRPGAGRPPAPDALKRKTVSIRLPQWLIDELKTIPGGTGDKIEAALIDYYNLTAPKGDKHDR